MVQFLFCMEAQRDKWRQVILPSSESVFSPVFVRTGRNLSVKTCKQEIFQWKLFFLSSSFSENVFVSLSFAQKNKNVSLFFFMCKTELRRNNTLCLRKEKIKTWKEKNTFCSLLDIFFSFMCEKFSWKENSPINFR